MGHSIQSIARLKQHNTFIGREQELSFFKRNLNDAEEVKKYFISIFGEKGVGKTWLLQQCMRVAESHNWQSAVIKDTSFDLLEAMKKMSQQLEPKNFNKFTATLERYYTKRDELEKDVDAPVDVSSFLGDLTRFGLKIGKIADHNSILSLVNENDAATFVSNASSYLIGKFGTNDSDLLQEPVETLSPLFIEGLNKCVERVPLVIFFDKFEIIGDFVLPWLIEIMDNENRYGGISTRIITVFSGLDDISSIDFAPYEELLERIHIQPFNSEEMESFFAKKGITKESNKRVIEQVTGNLPLLLASFSSAYINNIDSLGGSNPVEIMIANAQDEELEKLALILSIPRYFNKDIISLFSDDEHLDYYVQKILEKPYVEKVEDNKWVIHELVRPLMNNYIKKHNRKLWDETHKNLQSHFGKIPMELLQRKFITTSAFYQESIIEVGYHSIFTEKLDVSISLILNVSVTLLTSNLVLARIWANTTCEAGKESGIATISSLGKNQISLINAMESNNHTQVIEFAKTLISNRLIDSKLQANLKQLLVRAYMLDNQHSKALQELNILVKNHPGNTSYLFEKGLTLWNMQNYFEAIDCFEQVVKVSPEVSTISYLCYIERARIYMDLLDYAQSINMLQIAKSLYPDNAASYTLEGEIYTELQQQDLSLDSLYIAKDLAPRSALVHIELGKHFRAFGQYELAIHHLSLATELKPNRLHKCRHEIAYTYLSNNELAQAYTEAEIALMIEPKDITSWRIVIEQLQGNLISNENIVDILVHKPYFNKDKKEIVWVVAEALRLAELIEESYQLLDKYTKDNNWSLIKFTRGCIFETQKKFTQAIKEFDTAEINEPFMYQIKYHMGMCYFQKNSFINAETALKKAVSLFPNDIDLLTELSEVYSIQNKHEKALEVLLYCFSKRQYLSVSAINEVSNMTGLVYTYMNTFDKALAFFAPDGIEVIEDSQVMYNIIVTLAKVHGLNHVTELVRKTKDDFMIELADSPVTTYYGLAGIEALYNNAEKSLEYLKDALKIDNHIVRWAKNDRAFDNLRENPHFLSLIAEYLKEK